jgi:hypothetical protein
MWPLDNFESSMIESTRNLGLGHPKFEAAAVRSPRPAPSRPVSTRSSIRQIDAGAPTVPTKTERSARGLPVPPRELTMLKAMRSAHLRERPAVGRPLTDADLLLSRVDGTWLPPREYSREFAAQRTAPISRMRAAGIAADVVTAWHCHTERMTQAVCGRVTDDRLTEAADVLSSAVGQLGHKASRGSIRLTRKTRSDAGQNGFSTWS